MGMRRMMRGRFGAFRFFPNGNCLQLPYYVAESDHLPTHPEGLASHRLLKAFLSGRA